MRLQNLKTDYLGRNIIFYESIDSTQLEIWRRIQKNSIENGELVIAQIQTQGMRYSRQNMAYR